MLSDEPTQPPLFASAIPCRTSLSQIERAAIEGELNAFDVALGACERITRQAIPMAYTRCVLWTHAFSRQLHCGHLP